MADTHENEIESDLESETAAVLPTSDTADATSKNKRKPRTKKVYQSSEQLFEQLDASLIKLRELQRQIITLTRETQKSVKNEMRLISHQIHKDKSDNLVRKPRGFALPSPVSEAMVDYLVNVAKITEIERKVAGQDPIIIKIENGCKLARNELTSALCTHFRQAMMRKNDADKREIYLDQITAQLFGIDPKTFEQKGGHLSPSGEPIITYFDLQKYLPKHCVGGRSPPIAPPPN